MAARNLQGNLRETSTCINIGDMPRDPGVLNVSRFRACTDQCRLLTKAKHKNTVPLYPWWFICPSAAPVLGYGHPTTPGANENGVNAKQRETTLKGPGFARLQGSNFNILTVRVTPCLAAQRHIRKGGMVMKGS